jgi:hypothetical protein
MMMDAARRLLDADPDALARDALGLSLLCAVLIAGLSLPLAA